MRSVLFVGLFLFISLSATAQTISVRNLLNPDAPVARESFAAIETAIGGVLFSDQEINEPFLPTTTLGGVTVTVDGVAQRITAVSPTRVVILVDGPGRVQRSLQLRTKFNEIYNTSISIANVVPGIFLNFSGQEAEDLYPSGLWTIDGINRPPLTVAPISVGAASRPTLVYLQVAGLKLISNPRMVQVRLNGIPCPIVALRPSFFAGQDELVFQVPSYLAGNGVMDLILTAAGRDSNLARLNLGNAASLVSQ